MHGKGGGGKPLRAELYQRRCEMLRQHYTGIPYLRMVEALAVKYKVSRNTIISDFTRRDSWELLILGEPETEPFVIRLLGEMHQLRQRGWQILVGDHHGSVKVGALSTLFASISREVELLQSIGKVPKVPERLQQEIVGVQKIILENVSESDAVYLNRAAAILDKAVAISESKKKSNRIH